MMSHRFGEYLRSKRQACRISVVDAAAAAGVSRRTWTAWEGGAAQPHRVEAAAALKVVRASAADAAHAVSLITAPWAVQDQRQATTDRLNLQTLPGRGALLSAMRRRAALSLQQAAAALQVRPSTIQRWESGVHAPPVDRLYSLLTLLRASQEERVALTSGILSDSFREDKAPSQDELDFQAMAICEDACSGKYELMDLRFLTLEHSLQQKATRHSQARWTLSQVYTWHGLWLCWRGREIEAGRYADTALDMLRREFSTQCEWGRSLHASMHSALRRGVSPSGAIQMLQNWLPIITTPAHRAWMLRDLAGLYSTAGYKEAAIQTSEKAFSLAVTLPDPYEIRCAQADRAEIFFKTGQFSRALAALPTEDSGEVLPTQTVKEHLLRAEICLAVGDRSAGQDQLTAAYGVVERYALTEQKPAVDVLTNRL